MSNLYTVLDIETTGLSAAHFNEIIEVAAYHTDGVNILDSFHEYIKPWKSLPPKITELTHITEDMLKDKKNKWQILPRFREFIGDSIVVAHNATFDFNFLNIEFFNIGQPLLTKYICTQTNFKKLYPKQKYNLASVTEKFGVELINAHSALADVRATTEVFIKMLKDNELDTVLFTEKDSLINTLKRIVSAPPHKAQTQLMTSVPTKNNCNLMAEKDIITEFKLGKTPNDICENISNDYENVIKLFFNWLNPFKITKFYSLLNDKKLNKELITVINLCDNFDDFIDMNKKIYQCNEINLSICALYWSMHKREQAYTYEYNDFEWHFIQQKKILDIVKEFNISSFLVADYFVEFAIKNKEEFRNYIKENICTKNQLKSIILQEEFINIVDNNPSELDIKKYISQKLYNRNFFKIKF